MKKEYRPDGLWHAYDFQINKQYWKKRGHKATEIIRENNLVDLVNTLSAYGIFCWLQGKTLLGLTQYHQLIEDHDDDLGMSDKDLSRLLTMVKPVLESMGFRLIRQIAGIVSFERNYRYIDICVFHNINEKFVGYSRKKFPAYFYACFSQLFWQSSVFNVPADSAKLLKYMYENENKQWAVLASRINSIFFSGSLFTKLHRYLENRIYNWSSEMPFLIGMVLHVIGPLFKLRLIELSHDDFLKLKIEPEDSFNWQWRIRHLAMVTDDGRLRTVGDIVDYLSDQTHWIEIDRSTEETDTGDLFQEPINLDMDFWWGGNNYFWYCVKYQFKHGVVSYLNANSYIRSDSAYQLYSADYYNALKPMTDMEIEAFLGNTTLEISNNAITSGKHRVFAMIGRLCTGKSYIPMRAIEKYL